jgi:hypothetical protein
VRHQSHAPHLADCLQLLISLGSHHLIKAAAAIKAAFLPGQIMGMLSEEEKQRRVEMVHSQIETLVDNRLKLVREAECGGQHWLLLADWMMQTDLSRLLSSYTGAG